MVLRNNTDKDAVLNWGQFIYKVPANGTAEIEGILVQEMLLRFPFLEQVSLGNKISNNELSLNETIKRKRGRPPKFLTFELAEDEPSTGGSE